MEAAYGGGSGLASYAGGGATTGSGFYEYVNEDFSW